MGNAFKFMHPLPSKSMTAGGQVSVELAGLPIKARIASFLIEITGTATSASSTQAFTPQEMAKLIANVDIDSDFFWVRTTGQGLHVLNKMMRGYPVASAAQSVTATTGGVAARCFLEIPCADPRAYEPNDTAIPTRLIREKTINLNFKDALTLGTTIEVTMSNVLVRVFALLVPESGDVIPTATRIAHEDWSQKTANLKPGAFSHLGIYDESDLAVTIAQYAQLSVGLDGAQLYDRVQTQHFLAQFNRLVGFDPDYELSYQDGADLQFIPLIVQPDKYKLTQLPDSESEARVDIDSGTATGARYIYRQIVDVRDATARNAMIRLGHEPSESEIGVKTASNSPLQGSEERVIKHARRLPKRLGKQ